MNNDTNTANTLNFILINDLMGYLKYLGQNYKKNTIKRLKNSF